MVKLPKTLKGSGNSREQCWIDHYKDTIYNQEKYVLDDVGIHNNFFGKHHTAETKKLLSAQRKGKLLGLDNPNYGNKQPLSVRLLMSKNNSRTKLIAEDIPLIVDLLKARIPHEEIAKIFKVSRNVITRISNGTRWQNITGGPVFPVIYLDGIRQFSKDHRDKIGQAKREWKINNQDIKYNWRNK